MAFIRQILFLTFDDTDTVIDKNRIKNIFEKQGYIMIAETKIQETGVVKEIIMESPVQVGKLDSGVGIGKPDRAKIIGFDPTGGGK